MYGDPIYKQNVADIRERDRRLGKGRYILQFILCDHDLPSDMTKSTEEVAHFYVDQDRNISITDVKDIKGKLLNR